jgi:hypothetical protein
MFKGLVLISALGAAGCGPAWQVCTGQCPTVSGTYSIQTNALAGSCSFQPYLLGPTVVLTQRASEVSTTLVDPTASFPVSLAGSVLVPPAGTSSDSVAQVRMNAQAARGVSSNSTSIDAFEVRLHASVLTAGILSGSLETTSLGENPNDPPCDFVLQFGAQWVGP